MSNVGIQSKGTSPILLKNGGMPTRRKSAGNYRSTKSGAGMTQKGVMAYRRKNPGSKLKTAVTGKVKPGSKAAKRRKSYCARSLGQLKEPQQKQETILIQELDKQEGDGNVRPIKRNLEKNQRKNNSNT